MERVVVEAVTLVGADPRGDGGTGGAGAAEPQAHYRPGRYQHIADIGEGGMGKVSSVRDATLLRVSAMKVLAPRLVGQRTEVDRFLREARITAQLDHPNIVPVYELGTDPAGDLYFTMKKVDGRTLRAWIEEIGHPPSHPDELRDLLRVLLKVCDAVAFAHSRGVIHCDLKPDNVMVAPFGQVYLMDWGLALLLEDSGAQAAGPPSPPASGPARAKPCKPSGTPSFMSPEQASCKRLDERTDVFGLGAILYALLTGTAPYDGEDSAVALAQAREAVIRFPQVSQGLAPPPGLCEIARRAISSDAKDRQQSVLTLRGEVEAALEALPFSTQTFGPGTKIVVEGEPGECAYVVVRGTCVAYRAVDGERVVLRRLPPGSVFGEMAILSGGTRTATVEAEDEVVVSVVSRRLLEQNLGLGTPSGVFVVALAERFRELDALRNR